MANRRQRDPDYEPTPRKPARTPEERENQLIAMAHDEAERQILAGTASAQVVTHFLKLGSSRERLEQAKLQHENELMDVKKEQIASQARTEELFKTAIAAFRSYAGHEEPEIEGEYID